MANATACPHRHSGVFLLRRGEWASRLLDEVLDGDHAVFATHPMWDQAAL